jgi:chromosome partitioning protein
VRPTRVENLFVVPSHIDLSGAELELAAAFGRERLLKDAIDAWLEASEEGTGNDAGNNGGSSFDYVLFDCPPSLGLLSVNGMVAAREVILTLQTEFFALQGMCKLVDVIGLLRKRLNPELEIAGILPCLYDTRLRLAREVLAEIRSYFPGKVGRPIGKNVKLAEAPSYGQTIFEYAPDSSGAQDYRALAEMVVSQETPSGAPPDRPDTAEAPAAAAPGPRETPEAAPAVTERPAASERAAPARPPAPPAERVPAERVIELRPTPAAGPASPSGAVPDQVELPE